MDFYFSSPNSMLAHSFSVVIDCNTISNKFLVDFRVLSDIGACALPEIVMEKLMAEYLVRDCPE